MRNFSRLRRIFSRQGRFFPDTEDFFPDKGDFSPKRRFFSRLVNIFPREYFILNHKIVFRIAASLRENDFNCRKLFQSAGIFFLIRPKKCYRSSPQIFQNFYTPQIFFLILAQIHALYDADRSSAALRVSSS